MFWVLLGCSSPQTLSQEEMKFRVVMVSDSHVIGPQYLCCSESDGIDNSSIVKTADRLQRIVDSINQMDPPPDMVFMMGDVVHDAYHSEQLEWYLNNRNAFTVAQDILSALNVPFYPAFGNHDYHYRCDGTGSEKELSHQLFEEFFSVSPRYVLDHKGWKFVVANSQMGVTWDSDDLRCDTGKGSYGKEQLAWIDGQLQEGKPTIVMAHHMLPITLSNEAEGQHSDIHSVLSRWNNMKGFFVGHTHRWIDFTESYGFPHIVMGATRYDEDNFWLLEFSADATVEILDFEKAILATPCAEDWIYSGSVDYEQVLNDLPYPNPNETEENGDCQ